MIDKETIEYINREDAYGLYWLLGRMESDCKYYLGYGYGCAKHLWAGNVTDQIECMGYIYELLRKYYTAPDWINADKIAEYAKAMHAVEQKTS